MLIYFIIGVVPLIAPSVQSVLNKENQYFNKSLYIPLRFKLSVINFRFCTPLMYYFLMDYNHH